MLPTDKKQKFLRPKLKESSKRILEARKSIEKRQEPLNDIQKTKQKLTKQFIIKHSIFWTNNPSDSLSKIRSLVLRQLNLHTFESTQSFKLHELSMIELLSLSNNHIMVLQPLRELDSLISLNLNNNKIYDVSPLSKLQHLESLYLNNNKVKDISPLTGLMSLQLLHIYNNLIPYTEKEICLAVASRLTELDIEKNEVFKGNQKDQWIFMKMRKFNNEGVSSRQREQKEASRMRMTMSTFGSPFQSKQPQQSQQPFTPFRQTMDSFNLAPVEQQPESYIDIQKQLQEIENNYLLLDDKYEEEIVKNVRLKSQLHKKIKLQAEQLKKHEQNQDKIKKCQEMRNQIKQMRDSLFKSNQNPQLLTLLQLNLQYERNKVKDRQKISMMIESMKEKQKIVTRPFDADEQFVIEDEQIRGDMSQEQLNRILNENDDTLQQLRKELQQMGSK